MIKPKRPDNEEARLKALEAYQVLDTSAEKDFDDLAQLASRICRTPIALVSLVDPERQWFKAKVGLDACETERDIAFCAHAIHKTEILEVPDTLADERFRDNPLVTGEPFIRFYAGAPLITPEGYAIGTLCVISTAPASLSHDQRDALYTLARQVISQLELRKKVRELNRISQYKSDFLSNMSHEIRTPINGITGSLHLLENMPLNREQQHLVSLAQNSAEALSEIVNDILDLSRIESGKLALQPENFSLSQLITELAATHGIKASQKHLELICPAQALPQGHIRADALRLKQILNNLLSNALKFTHEGSVTVNVQLKQQTEKQAVAQFEVRDTGIGLTPEQTEKLFSRFEQASANTSKHYGGTGLGLSICRQLVEMMDGEIGVHSTAGSGSVFWFRIPVETEALTPLIPAPSWQQHHLLIIHPGKATRAFLQRLFQQWQTPALAVAPEHAHQAVKSYRDTPFSHLLIDAGAEYLPNGALSQQLLDAYPEDARPPEIILLAQAVHHETNTDFSQYCAVLNQPLAPDELFSVLSGQYAGNTDSQSEYRAQHPCFSGQVLVAEDNPTNQIVVKGLLEKLGLSVSIAEDGYQAMHLMHQHAFDLVLMDCQMPVMDGYQTTQELRRSTQLKTDPETPVVALTANAMQDDRQRCLDAGMNDFMAKPVHPQKLSSVLSRYLNGVSQPAEDSAADKDTTEDPTAPPVIFDLDAYRKRLSDDQELMQLAMEAALADLEQILETLKQTQDAQQAAVLHQLKGLAANSSALELFNTVKELEAISKAGDTQHLQQHFDRLEAQVNRFRQQAVQALHL